MCPSAQGETPWLDYGWKVELIISLAILGPEADTFHGCAKLVRPHKDHVEYAFHIVVIIRLLN